MSRHEAAGVRAQVVALQPAPGDKNGRVYAVNNGASCVLSLDHAERNLGHVAPLGFERTWVRLRRRQERFGYDGTLLGAGRPQPRRLVGSPEVLLEHGWQRGWHSLECVVSGVLRATATAPDAANRVARKRAAATPLRAFGADGSTAASRSPRWATCAG
ncbi:MAG: hypothetical protein KIT58_01415 [Planctomycetota bacterium]|nr:hypothetical protein [Planctomycetota bacterium]